MNSASMSRRPTATIAPPCLSNAARSHFDKLSANGGKVLSVAAQLSFVRTAEEGWDGAFFMLSAARLKLYSSRSHFDRLSPNGV
jgi:hypothetical protein